MAMNCMTTVDALTDSYNVRLGLLVLCHNINLSNYNSINSIKGKRMIPVLVKNSRMPALSPINCWPAPIGLTWTSVTRIPIAMPVNPETIT